ncbi:kanadaptin [Calliopsis andreniformis]|uniref:kanadaptin n=1 Tax=Calliopsis andreniformis TaxID=337506 RepID=UPI003FCEBA20
METDISVEQLMRERKENKFMLENRLNDERKEENMNDNCVQNCADDSSEDVGNATFKTPTVLIGPRRSRSVNKNLKRIVSTNENITSYPCDVTNSQECIQDPPFPYVEPPWGGKPEADYKMEVLKSGIIIETISLNKQSFYIIGRLPSCHLSLAHPTISRYHAVIQYRSEEDKENSKGFYVYDLGSTHGTFWNGNRIKPNVYVRVQGGHMLRFGCSHRKYILQAPLEDQEEESRYTVFELKEMRALELEKRRTKEEAEASLEQIESDGIDWGMGEDADEETDMPENPYACITDDDLVLEDPKKTLRGWFEREGYDLQYQVEEKGLGQFLCWVDLPMDDIVGHSVRAETLVKGKKKEAVVQCAMEACKILDKYGLLRQANHEARKRKRRNWEAEDYYDSDEDNFLDRTGSVERKREQRMRLAGKLEEKVETYDSLLKKHEEVAKRIAYLSNSIKNWQNNENSRKKESVEEDALDVFMSNLNSFALTKSDIDKMKLELQNLRKEETSLIKLLNLTRPANLPPLVSYAVTADEVTHKVTTKINVAQGGTSTVGKIQESESRLRKKKQPNRQIDGNNISLASNIVTDREIEVESEEEESGENKSPESSSSVTVIASTSVTAAITNTTAPVTISITTPVIATITNENKLQKQLVGSTTKKRREEQEKTVYDQNIYTDNYSMWVPPQDQIGDGKTNLNEKYGY